VHRFLRLAVSVLLTLALLSCLALSVPDSYIGPF
jgi:hypothetical protein